MNKKSLVICGSIFVRCNCVLCLWEITLTRGQSWLKRLEATQDTPIYRQHCRRWFEWTKQFTFFYQVQGFTLCKYYIVLSATHPLLPYCCTFRSLLWNSEGTRGFTHRVKMSTGVSSSAAPFAPRNWFEAKQTVVVWESSSVVLALPKWEPANLYFAHFIFCLFLHTLLLWVLIFVNM